MKKTSPLADQLSKNEWRTIATSDSLVLARVAGDSDTGDWISLSLMGAEPPRCSSTALYSVLNGSMYWLLARPGVSIELFFEISRGSRKSKDCHWQRIIYHLLLLLLSV